MKAVVCRNCAYFSKTVLNEDWGFCHFNPPIPVINNEGNQANIVPRVHFDEWCGRYKEKVNAGDRGQVETNT